MNKLLAGALIAALISAGACSSSGKTEAQRRNPAPCPNIIVLNDASRIVEFDGEQVLEDVAYTGEITNVRSGCRYKGDDPIDIDIEVELAFGKGPKAASGEKLFKYFVAVTRKDLEIITKKEFVVPVDFGGDRTIVVKKEDIDQIKIPRAGDHISGINFEIVVGFSLTPQQAIFNRSGKSLKFPNLK